MVHSTASFVDKLHNKTEKTQKIDLFHYATAALISHCTGTLSSTSFETEFETFQQLTHQLGPRADEQKQHIILYQLHLENNKFNHNPSDNFTASSASKRYNYPLTAKKWLKKSYADKTKTAASTKND